jgi:hypothetical protein
VHVARDIVGDDVAVQFSPHDCALVGSMPDDPMDAER